MSVEITASISPTLTPSAKGERDADAPALEHKGPVLYFRCEGLLPEPCRIDVALDRRADAVRSALDRALHLAAAEPVCQALEHWLRAGFDLVPLGDGLPPADETAPLRLRLVHRSGSCPALTLHLPSHLLPTLRTVPAEVVATLDLRFDPVPATCRVARLALDEERLARLGPGAVMLLPATFGGSWPVRLAAHGVSAGARLEPDAARLVLERGRLEPDPPADGTSAEAAHRVDVVLDAPVAFDPSHALGGAGAERAPLPTSLPESGFRCLVDGRARLVGHVAPVGAGYGFFALGRADDDPEGG